MGQEEKTSLSDRYVKVSKICQSLLDNPTTLQAASSSSSNNNNDNNTMSARRWLCSRVTKSHGRPTTIQMQIRPTVLSSCMVHIVISVIFLLSATTLSTYQQSYCPKSCTCDELNLEILCKGSLDKGLSGLPHTLNPNAERLTINNAQTSQLTGIDSIEKLKTLDLAHNRIAIIDFNDITKNTVLTSFNTSHNSIVELKDTLVTSALLDSDISVYNLDTIDEQIESKLRRKLPKINVVEFIVSHNSLTTLRNLTFIRWHKLQHLDLSHNQLSILDSLSLFGLNALETINLRSNRLNQLPSTALLGTTRSIYTSMRVSSHSNELSSLKYLDLSSNMFTYIGTNAFSMVGKAQEIYLESCNIQSISERAFYGLRSIHTLCLDKNLLQDIPTKSLVHLGSLKVLTLNENNLSSIEKDSFVGLTNLEELQLNRESFKEIEAGAFNGLNNLRRLKISHNSNLISVKPGALKHLPKLTLLELQSTSLPYIPGDLNHESLALIDLRNNPLECGCELRWLTSWLKKFNETIQSQAVAQIRMGSFPTESPLTLEMLNLTCAGPPALAGKTIIDLPISRLECLEPTSELNVRVGYATLFAIVTIVIFVCLINFIHNKKHLFTLLKENLVQNHMPIVSPYTHNLHKNVDNMKKESQLYSSDYENIDYGPQAQIYSVHGDQILYYGPQQHYSQQI